MSSPAAEAPVFADLTPERVLDALDAVGRRGDGRILQLNSYENRVFQVFLEDGDAVVAKFYRPGRWSDEQILEEHAFALELEAAEIPVVAPCVLQAAQAGVELSGEPPTLARAPGLLQRYRYAVAPRRAGRAPELDDPDVLGWIGRFIGRLHAVGSARRFAHRLTLTPDGFGRAARDWLLAHDTIAPDALPAWRAACDAALDAVQRAFDAAGALRTLRLHGDCHPGNLLWSDSGPHFVDLDDACNGPAVQDLWMLLSGDPAALEAQLAVLLDGYRAFMDFDPRERALIEPLRTLRMIHHSAWIARRWSDPAFPIAFPFFAGAAYWQQQAQELREQVEAMAR
ncbi:MAG: serine/threonine protein kinase [Betaproteobacteria bacterium]